MGKASKRKQNIVSREAKRAEKKERRAKELTRQGDWVYFNVSGVVKCIRRDKLAELQRENATTLAAAKEVRKDQASELSQPSVPNGIF